MIYFDNSPHINLIETLIVSRLPLTLTYGVMYSDPVYNTVMLRNKIIQAIKTELGV